MDPIRSISLQTAPALPAPAGAGHSAPILPKPELNFTPPEPQAPTQADVERARFRELQRAAASNPYPLGDRRFTIYKDTSGQYITRYTSLVDGRVSYVPEPDMFAKRRAPSEPLFDLKA